MPGSQSEPPQSDIDRWLNSLGFSRGNPFATAEANQERALLPEFFVDVDGYERIKGDQTVIVFAARGGGKSALRLVLASQSAPADPDSPILAIEYTDFDTLIAKRRDGHILTVEDHIPRLLRAGVAALLDALCGSLPSSWPFEQPRPARRRGRAFAMTIPAPLRARLAALIRAYYPALIEPVSLYERLQALDPAFAPDWSDFLEAARQRRLGALLDKSALGQEELARLFADLNDYSDTITDDSATPVEQLDSFTHLARMLGFDAVHFLIDSIDELPDTANNYPMQADILEPLLAHLPLMEHQGAAFKFFLANETHRLLLDRPTIRRDRLTDHAVTVAWDQRRLKRLLDERLAVYSAGLVHELAQLCPETLVESKRDHSLQYLGEWLETEMLTLAQGSPRRLLVAGQLLCQAHVQRSGHAELLEKADWEAAKLELMHKMPPLLRVRRDIPAAYVGDREVRLTVLQHKILLTLVDSKGQCKREELVTAVWGVKEGVGIGDATVDQAIGRLRKELGDDLSDPFYLRTERGYGFKLTHYEVN